MSAKVNISWEATSVVVAAATLVAALVFNGIQVGHSTEAQRQNADAQRQAQLATELGLITQLQAVMDESVYSRTPYARQFRELRAGRRHGLSAAAYQAVTREASNMDYFAWLFNNKHLTVRGADKLWGPLMVCEWKKAIAPAISNPARDLPNLLRFIRKRADRFSGLTPC